MLLGVTDAERFSLEMTALAEATLAAGVAAGARADGGRALRRPARRGAAASCPRRIVGLGKLGGRELTTGSDLDLFVVYGGRRVRPTASRRVDAHVFYDRAVEALSRLLGDITAAGVAFAVDLRLRPGSKGSGFAASVDALERYYREWADPWERQTLTRARLVRRRSARSAARCAGASAGCSTGPRRRRPTSRRCARCASAWSASWARRRPGRFHVKFGRGGLVDVEFLTQALQLRPRRRASGRAPRQHAARHPRDRGAPGSCPRRTAPRSPSTIASCGASRSGLRLFGARPDRHAGAGRPDTRRALAKTLDYPSRKDFLEDYRRRTAWVRALYDRVVAK